MGSISKAQGAVCSKCGRRNFLSQAQIDSGFTCPRCGTYNIPDNKDEAPSASSEQAKDEPKDITLECPICRLSCLIPKERRFKLLCLCPHCSSIFIKPKPAPAVTPKQEEPPKAPSPSVVPSQSSSTQEPGQKSEEKAVEPQPSAELPATSGVSSEASRVPVAKTPETSTVPAPTTDSPKPPATAPVANPATPEQRRLLSEFMIAGAPDSQDHANELISTVNGIAIDAVGECFLGFHHLHQSTRAPLLKNLVASPLFLKIYFENQSPGYEDLRLLVEEVFEEDKELRASLRVNVDDSVFGYLVDYIDNYASLRHRLSLEQSELRILALKAFHRGFGGRLRPASSGVYGRDGGSGRNPLRVSKSEMQEMVRRDSEENRALEILLQDAGFVKRPDPYDGCLLFAAFALATPAVMAYMLF